MKIETKTCLPCLFLPVQKVVAGWRHIAPSILGKSVGAIVLIFVGLTNVPAKDLGVDGTLWPITEPDLLVSIQEQLHAARADGRMAHFNQAVQGQIAQAFDTPRRLNLARATKPRLWSIDPTVVVSRNIHTPDGVLIAAAGTRLNPLAHVGLRQPLLFINGRDPDQLDWALAQTKASSDPASQSFDTHNPAKIILTDGKPAQLMAAHDRRFYFDQKAVLSSRFKITALPAIIRQDGLVLKGEEVLLIQDNKEKTR